MIISIISATFIISGLFFFAGGIPKKFLKDSQTDE